MLKAPPPAREPLERISVGESLARTAQKFGEFQEQGGLAGLLGMEPAATRLARSSRVIRQRLEAGEPIQADPEAMDLALNFSPASLTGMIRAFHGTPHQFGKFDLSKIGTGEGAQAYGHGLYFAGNKGTAKTYRDNLSSWPSLQKLRFNPDGSPNRPGQVAEWLAVARNRQRPVSELYESLKVLEPDATKAQMDDWITKGREILKEADNKGNLYTVDIDAHADELLDWDVPLSQQSEKVKKAVTGPMSQARTWKETQTGDIWNMTGEDLMRRGLWESDLRRDGIKGIRYLDEGSRGVGDVLYEIRSKKGSFSSVRYDTKAQATKQLTGYKNQFPDAEIVEIPTDRTHNFVVFDDSILNIVNE